MFIFYCCSYKYTGIFSVVNAAISNNILDEIDSNKNKYHWDLSLRLPTSEACTQRSSNENFEPGLHDVVHSRWLWNRQNDGEHVWYGTDMLWYTVLSKPRIMPRYALQFQSRCLGKAIMFVRNFSLIF